MQWDGRFERVWTGFASDRRKSFTDLVNTRNQVRVSDSDLFSRILGAKLHDFFFPKLCFSHAVVSVVSAVLSFPCGGRM